MISLKRMLRPIVLYLLFCSIFQQVIAQDRTIRGSVLDERNNPVTGASITIKGTSIGTAADSSGAFAISVPASAKTLVISSVGYTPKELSVGGKTTFTITLAS